MPEKSHVAFNMNVWERARTNAQKELREKEILNAARKFLLEKSYESITLSEIASQLSFSRANIYQYFESKEEVYLSLLAEEVSIFGKTIYNQLTPIYPLNNPIQEFTTQWSTLLSKEKILLLLLSMTGTILERNSSHRILLQSKICMAEVMKNDLSPTILRFFPERDERTISKILRILIISANGLYSFCGLNNTQKEVLHSNNLEFMIYDFNRDYQELLAESLTGILQ